MIQLHYESKSLYDASDFDVHLEMEESYKWNEFHEGFDAVHFSAHFVIEEQYESN